MCRARILAAVRACLSIGELVHDRPSHIARGSGARLWPLSRAMYPKQFIRFFDGQGTLLGATLRRVKGPTSPRRLWCAIAIPFLVREKLAKSGVEAQTILLEPVTRNTATAVAAAALVAARNDGDANLAILPCDHLIRDTVAFRECLIRASGIAESGKIVLFGSSPSARTLGTAISNGARRSRTEPIRSTRSSRDPARQRQHASPPILPSFGIAASSSPRRERLSRRWSVYHPRYSRRSLRPCRRQRGLRFPAPR